MNKLLKSVTTRMHMTSNANQDRISIAPDMVEATLKIDMETWRYFENLDEDTRQIMSRVLNDYVEKQK
jgi:hypothetical protein